MTQITKFPNNRKSHRLETSQLVQEPLRANSLKLDIRLNGELARLVYANSLTFGKAPEDIVIDGLRALLTGGDAA